MLINELDKKFSSTVLSDNKVFKKRELTPIEKLSTKAKKA
jgi:hypothetical protein